jgi:hypothetical protein
LGKKENHCQKMPAIPKEPLKFLTKETASKAALAVGTPCYVYDEETLRANARAVKAFPNAFGLTARYAMKANASTRASRPAQLTSRPPAGFPERGGAADLPRGGPQHRRLEWL